MTDLIVINKADGESIGLANQTKQFYQSAFNIFRTQDAWKPQILTCSALEKKNLDGVWQMICDFESQARQSGSLEGRRKHQNLVWLKKLITMELEQRVLSSDEVKKSYPSLEERVAEGRLTPFSAARQILDMVMN